MFNTTHTLVGLAIARIGADKWVRHAAVTAVIASNLPDLDSVAGLWGTPAYLDHHRGITHSLTGVPLFALLLSAVMYFFTRKFWRTYAVALIAMATHPALDYLNSYGWRPFLPWSGQWYYGDLLFIFDPLLDSLLALGLLAGRFLPNQRRAAALASLGLAAAYVGIRIELHARASSQVAAMTPQNGRVERWAVLPTFGNPNIWDVIVVTNAALTRFDVCAVPCRARATAPPLNSTPMNNNSSASEVLARATATRSAQAFFRFARFPITRVDPSPPGYRVTFMDFRFYRPSTATALGSEVLLDQSLSVTQENLSFVHRITTGE